MRKINIELPHNKYQIYIKYGLLNDFPEQMNMFCFNKKVAIITDSNVQSIYESKIKQSMSRFNCKVYIIAIKPGEESKSFETAQYLYNQLINLQLSRDDLIIAFGGGVVGDLAGFVAATLYRGIPFIQIPTSLLAQVDSSIGGKVAINLPQGKNLVGAFYHPKAVFIDTSLLKTLEKKYLYDGMAEVIKYSLIRDKELYGLLSNINDEVELYNSFDEIIFRCCSIKKYFVENDEKDVGVRMILNFGHTIGHALEKYYKYNNLTHGEAIAIGMNVITSKSEDMGLTKSGTTILLKDIIQKYKLPYHMPKVNMKEIINIITYDKKNTSQGLNLILLKEIGEAFIKSIAKKEVELYLT